MEPNKLDDQLFRHSYSKTVAILVGLFGLKEIATAEDIVQDTLVAALEQWSVHGIPTNPDGWIMDVAKKKTINHLKRTQLFETKVVTSWIESQHTAEGNSDDSTLRLIFACCHPALPIASQIALALKTLCGLSVPEISRALLTSEDNINKRLYRAKEKFRTEHIVFTVPDEDEFEYRINGVCKTLYLLFNEGYYSPNHQELIRMDMCYEAIRLIKEVHDQFEGNSKVNGLLSMMYFSIARFESRLSADHTFICLQDQDRSLWDRELIQLGFKHLSHSIEQTRPNSYQIQAGIAAEHCLSPSFEKTNWQSIYDQYTLLETIEQNELIQINKIIAFFFLGNKELAIEELKLLKIKDHIRSSTSYLLTLATFYKLTNNMKLAEANFDQALQHAQSDQERSMIQSKLDQLKPDSR
ncbi:MAG: hypothetical protein JXQ90_08505 [Cyclobacteriaceae bacterium]